MRKKTARGVAQASDELVQLRNFRWPVCSEGFQWISAYPMRDVPNLRRAKPRLFLIPRPGGQLTPLRELDQALFQEFAVIDQKPDSLLDFANRCGWLGVVQGIIPRSEIRSKTELKALPVKSGEDIHVWISEVRLMNRLVRLWSQTTRQPLRSGKFKHRFRHGPEAVWYEWETENDSGAELVADSRSSPEILNELQKLFGANGLDRVLLWYLQRAVNAKLSEHRIHVAIFWDRDYEKLGLTMVPRTLIGFLWLQFARAIQGDLRFRQCEDCRKWFECGGSSSRADKRFCSGTCKARSHRAKRAAR